jgi:hypothetical protein
VIVSLYYGPERHVEKVLDERERMASSWERRDEAKEARLYNALGAALNTLIETEGASNAVIAQACGEFYAQVFAALSVENGETPEELEHRLTSHLQALEEAVVQRAQAMWRARQQPPPPE